VCGGRRHVLATSEQEMPIVGMNLLRLMVQNRTAEFHTQLELLSPEVRSQDPLRHQRQNQLTV
jgi:26S proteasome regulatory subunit N12